MTFDLTCQTSTVAAFELPRSVRLIERYTDGIMKGNEMASIKIFCWNCKKHTNHSIGFSKSVGWGEEVNGFTLHQMVECLGCENLTYRKQHTDYEMLSIDEHGDPEPDISEVLHPQEEDFKEEIDTIYLPEPISALYSETVRALNSKSFTLAAIGLRATLEAICIEQGIVSRNLETKINELHKKGKISVAEKDRLHAIRFLGNDAAHDFVKPKRKSISVALKIIENTIFQIYIIDSKASFLLEYPITEEKDLFKLLENKMGKLNVGQPITLSAIFKEDLRRLYLKDKELHAFIDSKISDGTITKLVKSAHTDPLKKGLSYYELTP
jgi:hypothetical protein